MGRKKGWKKIRAPGKLTRDHALNKGVDEECQKREGKPYCGNPSKGFQKFSTMIKANRSNP